MCAGLTTKRVGECTPDNLLFSNGNFYVDAHFSLGLPAIGVAVEATEGLGSFDVARDLCTVASPVQVVLGPATNVSSKVSSVVPRDAAEGFEAKP